jgi:hypothetical protein
VAVVAAAAFALGSVPDAQLVPAELAGSDQIADMDSGLIHSVRRLGGPDAVLQCGTPTTPWYEVTALAWDLGVPADDVNDRPVGHRPIVFTPKQGSWRVSEARRCRLVLTQSAQVRDRPPHKQRAHHASNA